MTKVAIKRKLLYLVRKKTDQEIDETFYSENLFSEEINFSARDLLYLYFFIQDEFDIEINKKYILDGSFSTINSIVDIIDEALQTKEKATVS